ncbi:hypothetical protein CVS40_12860, partial [Lucilia cuprina]
KLIFLCIKNFGVKLERSTIVCAINLIEEVLESSSSSDDEEDEIYAYRSFQINNWKTFFSIFVATEHRIKAEGASYLLRHRFCHFCEVGNLFGMSLSTIHNYFNNVLDFYHNRFSTRSYKVFPNNRRKAIVLCRKNSKRYMGDSAYLKREFLITTFRDYGN